MKRLLLKKMFFLFLIIVLVNSCTFAQIKPKNSLDDFEDVLKEASPDFRQGWLDGCESGSAGGENSFYQSFIHINKQDGWKMATSPEYSLAWNKAMWYCLHNEYVDAKSPIYGSMFKGYQ